MARLTKKERQKILKAVDAGWRSITGNYWTHLRGGSGMNHKAKHTPGLWEVVYAEDEPTRPLIMQTENTAPLFLGEPDPRFIALVGCESPIDGWDQEDQANAHLIAASPTMYGKLVDTVAWLDRELGGWFGRSLLRDRLEELRDDLAETLRKIEP